MTGRLLAALLGLFRPLVEAFDDALAPLDPDNPED